MITLYDGKDYVKTLIDVNKEGATFPYKMILQTDRNIVVRDKYDNSLFVSHTWFPIGFGNDFRDNGGANSMLLPG